jgi:hypothetical protein
MLRVFTPFRTNHWAKGAQSCADCATCEGNEEGKANQDGGPGKSPKGGTDKIFARFPIEQNVKTYQSHHFL